MKILLTGATSYVGQELIAAMQHQGGFEIDALVRRKISIPGLRSRYWDGHCESLLGLIEQSRPAVVINLAAESIAHPPLSRFDQLIEANLKLPLGLLEAMKICKVPAFIQAASYWQVAGNKVASPLSSYALTKDMIGSALDYYCQHAGLAAISLFLGDVIGARDPRSKLLPSMISALRNKTVLPMTKGDQLMYPVDVQDVAASFLRSLTMLEAGLHQKYLVTGEAIRVRDFVKVFASVWQQSPPVALGAVPKTGSVFEQIIDCLPVFPGGLPRHSLIETLTRIKTQEAI